jgi:5-methyltetrahydrofolate--homocysteine methyltransferase
VHTLIENLLKEKPIVTDGAWGTMLHTMGLKPGECADVWNISKPDKVAQIAHAYVKSGSRIILTNTFRANRLTLRSYNLDLKLKEINIKGVEISKQAIKKKGFVFASIGPVGSLLGMNKISDELLREAYSEQSFILADAGADAIVIETINDMNEAKIAFVAAKDTGLPVVVSINFNKDVAPPTFKTADKLVDVMQKFPDADIIGINCGTGIEHCLAHIKNLKSFTKAPLWLKPSAGIPSLVRGKVVYPTSSKIFVEYYRILISLGVNFIGGCCGTTPEYIDMLSKSIRKHFDNK